MGLDMRVHQYSTDPNTGVSTINKIKPYRRFGAKGKPDVYMQEGTFYYPDGSVVPDSDLETLGFDLSKEPTSMPEHPKIKEIVQKAQDDSLENWAHDLIGSPSYRRRK